MSSFFNSGSLSHELKYGFGYRKAPVTSFSEYPGGSYALMFQTTLGAGNTGGAYLFRPTNFKYDVKSNDFYVGDTMMMGNLTLQVLDLLYGGSRIDGHPAHRVGDCRRMRRRRVGHASKHVDASRREESPAQHGHQGHESDVEKRRVVPRRLRIEHCDMVV